MSHSPVFIPTYFLGINLKKKLQWFFNIYIDAFLRVVSVIRTNSILLKGELRY
jgi:hypothetical protein